MYGPDPLSTTDPPGPRSPPVTSSPNSRLPASARPLCNIGKCCCHRLLLAAADFTAGFQAVRLGLPEVHIGRRRRGAQQLLCAAEGHSKCEFKCEGWGARQLLCAATWFGNQARQACTAEGSDSCVKLRSFCVQKHGKASAAGKGWRPHPAAARSLPAVQSALPAAAAGSQAARWHGRGWRRAADRAPSGRGPE